MTVAPDERPTEVTARLEATMAAMLDDVQRGYEDGTPAGAWWVPARLGGGAPDHAEVLAAHEARFRGDGRPPRGDPDAAPPV